MESTHLLLLAIASIGFISLSKLILSIFISLTTPPKDLKRYGSWAIITGCTDGIGKAIAFELASKGLNLVLVGRNPLKLESTSSEIQQSFGSILSQAVDIKTVTIDFAKCDHGGEEISRVLEEAITGLDIGILVNNAGFAYPYARFFHEVDLELMENVIRVNVQATTWVTKAVLPGMLKKRKGAIVNIGSGSSGVTSSYPLYTVYAATKAYLAMFSRSIGLEYKQHGIDIQCQIPLLVATKMASIKKTSFFIPGPETYSKASVKWIGHRQICMPYWPHYLQGFIMKILPESLLDWCLYRYFLGMRMRGMKKDARIDKGVKSAYVSPST